MYDNPRPIVKESNRAVITSINGGIATTKSHRDNEAEQHDRQINCLGRADRPAERNEQDFFPPHSPLPAQPQAERHVAEHHAQHRRIGRKAGR